MYSLFGGTPEILREIQRKADEQKAVISILMLFPDAEYHSHPTHEQFYQFAGDAVRRGYTLDGLYRMFASGKLDSTIDALICKHAQGWRPAGAVVEGTADMPLLPSPE